MASVNLIFAWIWMLTGLTAGILHGLYFHRESWMGGYASWRRRLARLGHIAFIGTALLNIALWATLRLAEVHSTFAHWASWFMLVGGVTMPLICYLAAWRQSYRHLFAIPVIGLHGGATLVLIAILKSPTTIAGASP